MDCIEFMKGINDHSTLLVNTFDALMALYNLVGKFEGIQVINNCTAAKIMFTVEGEEDNLSGILRCINNMQVSGYGIYECSAWIENGSLSIMLTEI